MKYIVLITLKTGSSVHRKNVWNVWGGCLHLHSHRAMWGERTLSTDFGGQGSRVRSGLSAVLLNFNNSQLFTQESYHAQVAYFLSFRDIKPENIIVNDITKSVKLIDLGTATKFEDSQPRKRKRIGTVNYFLTKSYYIAPEVLKR